KPNAKGLGTIFSEAPFNFTVTTKEIDYQNRTQEQIEDSFIATLSELENKFMSADKETSDLLILYYGGHGVVDGDDRLWQPTQRSNKKLFWSNHHRRMYSYKCDILYLFDCCYSLAMVETTSTKSHHRQRCEILCSSGLKEQSGALEKTVFTRALKELLAKKTEAVLGSKDALGGMTFESICDTMTKQGIRKTLRAEPRWRPVAPNEAFRGRITMVKKEVGTAMPQPQRDGSDSGYESEIESRSQLSDTRILIKIRLTSPAEGLSSDDWLRWFEQRPHNVAHIDLAVIEKIEWVGVFESDSSLALITIPLWLWNNMAHDPACESLGIVRSQNLLQRPTRFIDPGARDGKTHQPLWWVAEKGQELLAILLDAVKDNPDAKDRECQTPLLWAIWNGHGDIVKMLLDTGKVDPDMKNIERQTPLWHAAQYGHEAVVKMLLDTGKVDPDAKDREGQTPLAEAAEYVHEAVVKMLLETGKADPNAKDGEGRTTLSQVSDLEVL
ncbi:hypothetical protein LTS00_017486, partial [Friedmanniomyces endolithicus]